MTLFSYHQWKDRLCSHHFIYSILTILFIVFLILTIVFGTLWHRYDHKSNTIIIYKIVIGKLFSIKTN